MISLQQTSTIKSRALCLFFVWKNVLVKFENEKKKTEVPIKKWQKKDINLIKSGEITHQNRYLNIKGTGVSLYILFGSASLSVQGTPLPYTRLNVTRKSRISERMIIMSHEIFRTFSLENAILGPTRCFDLGHFRVNWQSSMNTFSIKIISEGYKIRKNVNKSLKFW